VSVTFALPIRRGSELRKLGSSLLFGRYTGLYLKEAFMGRQLTAVIEREEARANLREAVELFFETVSNEEGTERLHDEVYVTRSRSP
jgi:hypothetical protein